MNEYKFENELIEYLCTGSISSNDEYPFIGKEDTIPYIKKKLWKYEPDIKTTEQLWNNFKRILERLNRDTLEYPLSVVEFNQVKKIISEIKNPYEAGQFLYGLNGVSQIEIDLDDGRHVFLTVFDQKQIGAGETVYQVVNQIERPAKIIGKQSRRFDTTLLINGLPIIQIEEKRRTRDINEAFNQMHQYIAESQYRDIFSTLQILVALSSVDVKYMANTTSENFNIDFAFNWQGRDGKVVRDWKKFANQFLSIPMAHQMATNYMILDGTKNKQSLKVMRPYQVYATQIVLDKIKTTNFEMNINKIGYIWHTTGSGKTITSFKTAWLASRMPNVEKVVFVVDRIALTKQTSENYRAYDPDASDDFSVIDDTANTTELNKKLKSKDNNIIITSVQKLDTLVKRKSFVAPKKRIVFIVDEAHRSTGGDSFELIQKSFKNSAWVGYTGTPMFEDTTFKKYTEEIFGPLLHAYTIRNAIADRNVLGFKVDFETTINEDDMKEKYLPDFYREKFPKWSDKQIQEKINNLTPEDMDDAVESSFYDCNQKHVELVVEDIFEKWRNRSNDGKYNALLTTHVGGMRPSTPMALMYFNEFQKVNKERQSQGLKPLNVAVTYSLNASNNDYMLDSNQGLHEAMKVYNEQFGTAFGLNDVSGYTQDVISRLNKTASDKKYLDIVIVVDQLLTGFDAPELNTLYVDRTLKGASLIQAYSRTNRIADWQEKPFGRIVNYRWPSYNEKLMNDALAIYADDRSVKYSDEEKARKNKEDGITVPEFNELLTEVKVTVEKLKNITDTFNQLPPSEKEKEFMLDLLRDYNAGIAKLKQFAPEEVDGETTGFDYNNPNKMIEALGMTPEQEVKLTTVLTNELKTHLAKKRKISFYQIDLKLTHIKEVKVDYDYLTTLIENLINEVHEEKLKEAQETQEKIVQFTNGLADRLLAEKIKSAALAIINGEYPPAGSNFTYPVKLNDSDTIIDEAYEVNVDRTLIDFRNKWGIIDVINNSEIKQWFSSHRYGAQDLDDINQLSNLITEGSKCYKIYSNNKEVTALSRIKYRNGLREAIYDLADKLVGF